MSDFNSGLINTRLFFEEKEEELENELLVRIYNIENGPFVTALVLKRDVKGLYVFAVDLLSLVDGIRQYLLFFRRVFNNDDAGTIPDVQAMMNYLIHFLWYREDPPDSCYRYCNIWFPVLGMVTKLKKFQMFKVVNIYCDMKPEQLVVIFKPLFKESFLLAPCANGYVDEGGITCMEFRCAMTNTGYEVKVVDDNGRVFCIRSKYQLASYAGSHYLVLRQQFLENPTLKVHNGSVIKRRHFFLPKAQCVKKHTQEVRAEQGTYRIMNRLETEL